MGGGSEGRFMEESSQKTGILKSFNSAARKQQIDIFALKASKKQPYQEERKITDVRIKWASVWCVILSTAKGQKGAGFQKQRMFVALRPGLRGLEQPGLMEGVPAGWNC